MAIQQPKNTFDGKMGIVWSPTFAKLHGGDFAKAQAFIDSEVLRHCAPRVPFDTGALQKSGILNTVIGSGQVTYKTPYARWLYYNPDFHFQGAPMRGGQWFERMKADVGDQIRNSAGRIAGGRK